MVRGYAVLAFAFAFAFASHVALAAVNLNTASKDELIALPGIGPAKAQAIIDHRTQHGGFKTLDELKDVKGIGARQFEKLKPELTLTPAQAPVKPATRAENKSGSIAVKADGKPQK
jgi:competence protein ComEA